MPTYEIRLSGLISLERLLEQVDNVASAAPELRTVLRARLVDQADLHGFLNRLQSLGLEVVEVRRRPDDPGQDGVGYGAGAAGEGT